MRTATTSTTPTRTTRTSGGNSKVSIVASREVQYQIKKGRDSFRMILGQGQVIPVQSTALIKLLIVELLDGDFVLPRRATASWDRLVDLHLKSRGLITEDDRLEIEEMKQVLLGGDSSLIEIRPDPGAMTVVPSESHPHNHKTQSPRVWDVFSSLVAHAPVVGNMSFLRIFRERTWGEWQRKAPSVEKYDPIREKWVHMIECPYIPVTYRNTHEVYEHWNSNSIAIHNMLRTLGEEGEFFIGFDDTGLQVETSRIREAGHKPEFHRMPVVNQMWGLFEEHAKDKIECLVTRGCLWEKW